MESMSLSEREEAIDAYDLSFVYEKIKRESKLSGENMGKLELEFKRFMKLVLNEEGPLAMIDIRVDEIWHSFILFTPQYQQFCEQVMGFFVHHQPRTSVTPVPEAAIVKFVTAYQRRYGELDPLWLEKIPADLREAIASGDVSLPSTFQWSGWTGRPRF